MKAKPAQAGANAHKQSSGDFQGQNFTLAIQSVVRYGSNAKNPWRTTMAERITFEQWNETPNHLKPGKEAVLRNIERRPAKFTFFDDGSVQDSRGEFVLTAGDYGCLRD